MPRSYRPQAKNPFKLLALLLLLAWGLWMLLSPWGFWQYTKLSRQISELQNENSHLVEENRQLQEEIEKLQNNPDYIEELARREYDFLRENELLFDFR